MEQNDWMAHLRQRIGVTWPAQPVAVFRLSTLSGQFQAATSIVLILVLPSVNMWQAIGAALNAT